MFEIFEISALYYSGNNLRVITETLPMSPLQECSVLHSRTRARLQPQYIFLSSLTHNRAIQIWAYFFFNALAFAVAFDTSDKVPVSVSI